RRGWASWMPGMLVATAPAARAASGLRRSRPSPFHASSRRCRNITAAAPASVQRLRGRADLVDRAQLLVGELGRQRQVLAVLLHQFLALAADHEAQVLGDQRIDLPANRAMGIEIDLPRQRIA